MSLRRLGGYVYVMKSNRLFFRCKIGVTKNPRFRIMEVDYTTKGKVKYVVYYKFWFPYVVEGMLHAFLRPLRARQMKGSSGGTEWFWLPPFWGGFILFCVWVMGMILSFLFVVSVLIIGLIYIRNGEMDLEGVGKLFREWRS